MMTRSALFRTLSVVLIVAGLCAVSPVSTEAQDRLPFREFTNPDELVTLGGETTISQSMIILAGFARRFGDKLLIDRSARSGAIGMNIPNMHWRQALDVIAAAHNMRVEEFPDFIEITPMPAAGTRDEGRGTVQAAQRAPQGGDGVVTVDMNTREVEISAIFFEGNRRKLREIGIDWSAIRNGVVTVTNLAAGSVSLPVVQAEMPVQEAGGWEVSALLNTLEALSIGDILSSPRVKVMDGRQGDIQVGQDFSIKQRDFAGNITDAFFSTGTILMVTPRIISENDTSFILLDIRAERSTANPDPVSTIINKQEAMTQVILYSGESTVIAGLYETEETSVRRGIPFLKDLPPWFFGLRYLFGYNSYEINQNELIIVITAEIIPSLRERFNQPRDTRLETLEEGRRRLLEVDRTGQNE
jgi:general secretion pathway protein D